MDTLPNHIIDIIYEKKHMLEHMAKMQNVYKEIHEILKKRRMLYNKTMKEIKDRYYTDDNNCDNFEYNMYKLFLLKCLHNDGSVDTTVVKKQRKYMKHHIETDDNEICKHICVISSLQHVKSLVNNNYYEDYY